MPSLMLGSIDYIILVIEIGGLPHIPLWLVDKTKISSVDSIKKIGATVNSNFKALFRCQHAANQARRILFQLCRGFAVFSTYVPD